MCFSEEMHLTLSSRGSSIHVGSREEQLSGDDLKQWQEMLLERQGLNNGELICTSCLLVLSTDQCIYCTDKGICHGNHNSHLFLNSHFVPFI